MENYKVHDIREYSQRKIYSIFTMALSKSYSANLYKTNNYKREVETGLRKELVSVEKQRLLDIIFEMAADKKNTFVAIYFRDKILSEDIRHWEFSISNEFTKDINARMQVQILVTEDQAEYLFKIFSMKIININKQELKKY